MVTDFDRQVRAKSHTVHSLICLAAGKRFVKQLKTCIGPWIASRYDSDKQVARAAEESFRSVFDTEKKREIVWEKYSADVLKFVIEILTKETATTISKLVNPRLS